MMTLEGQRRVIRANRLLAELGGMDILDALEELKRLRNEPVAWRVQQSDGKWVLYDTFPQALADVGAAVQELGVVGRK